ncbi:MAG: DUF2092 domain-containing protein [Pirellulaceae bacterium]|nr:DUF2092 domain-containing protein [Pirellulaceae bacterium]
MNRLTVTLATLAATFYLLAAPLSAEIVAKRNQSAAPAAGSADASQFAQTLGAALAFLGRADNYVVRVDTNWKATGDAAGQEGQSKYRLIAQGAKHRIEVQSAAATAPQLVAVRDDQHVTTLLVSQGLYSQHPLNSPQASLASNKMLAQSLSGSALDVLLQPNIGQFVQAQASNVRDLGTATLGTQSTRHFQVDWAGARVELWFAATGDPLLVQFTHTSCVPTGEDSCYEMTHTARFSWQLNARLPEGVFALALPQNARRVNDIYDTLSGDDPATRIGKPLPKIQLSHLDGSTIDVAVPEGKRGLVMIFWATWCSPSIEDLPAVSEFVKAYAQKGLAFYAVNVGDEPGDVRRFTAKSPLVSAIALDPQGKASSALRVTQLPAAVVVNADGTVRAIHLGEAQQVQADLAHTLDTLLAAPASTARRPGTR